MSADIYTEVESLILPVIQTAGLELVELTVSQAGTTYMIEVLVDRPLGGITLKQCAAVNKQIAQAIDLTQSWTEDYELTVASPGLDRRLKSKKDFSRTLGQQVRILLTEKIEGKGEYSGIVHKAEQTAVVILLKNKEISLPYDKILKAVLVI